MAAKNPFSSDQWLTILFTLLAATAFAFGNFETKNDSKDKESRLDKRLERIENLLIQLKNK